MVEYGHLPVLSKCTIAQDPTINSIVSFQGWLPSEEFDYEQVGLELKKMTSSIVSDFQAEMGTKMSMALDAIPMYESAYT